MKPNLWRVPLGKVLLLFVLGIITPTAFLVYLGLHSIRAETALLRKQAEERMDLAAGSMRARAQESIQGLLKPFNDFVQNHPLPGAAIKTGDRLLLKELQRQQKAETLLVLDARDRILFPFNENPPLNRPLPELENRFAAALHKAEQLEFQSQDLAAALREYEALAGQVKESRWKALLMMRMAGCLSKSKEDERAQALYQQIALNYDQELNENSEPLGLTAASQIAALLRRQGRLADAALQEQKLLRDILAPRWALSQQIEEFYGQRLRTSLLAGQTALSPAQQITSDEVLNKWDRYQLEVKRLKNFKERVWPSLKAQLIRAHRSNVSTVVASQEASELMVYTPLITPGTDERHSSLLAIVPESRLIESWKRELQPLAGASQMSFSLQSPSGKQWLAPSTASRKDYAVWEHALDDILPAVHLQTTELRDWPVERTVANRQKIYLAMIALAALVISVALYTVWYAVSREMEIAQLKAGFVASVSHELKTPLSIISLIGQKLKLKRYQSAEEQDDYYTMLGEETERLKGLIDDVLDFSRLLENRKPYQRRPVDFAALIDSALERCVRSASTRTIHANFIPQPRPFSALIDPDAMERVVVNLIDNAIKYSPPERISIQITLKREGTTAILEVTDQGFGIPSDELHLIFERFFRGRSASQNQKTNGVGLGLSIVRHIVEAHGGTISVKSQENQGSCFTIQFPSENVA